MIRWTVDYEDGPRAVDIPHAWGQDVPVTWEGPATYACTLPPPAPDDWLVFEGVSYRAKVWLNGKEAAEHEGIWDAFAVPLGSCAGRPVDVQVEVTKNGGRSFPVRDVLSGFLPYVYHTFGGIFRPVQVVAPALDPALGSPAPATRVRVSGTQIFVDGRPFHMRGVLSWGWYPEIGHPHPPPEVIAREVSMAREMGFNTVKFCLWVPPHEYLEELNRQGMFAWLELPLWSPGPTINFERIAGELERIVRQYRRHDNVIAWTVGCELGASLEPDRREALTRLVQDLTGCPLVRDDSGGAEMYGGDPREYGTFNDYHPYCDLPLYPPVLDSLLPGPRVPRPTLLGEFNDYDTWRDLPALHAAEPYWASHDPALNDQGVRWQHDLPLLVSEIAHGDRTDALRRRSISKSAFIRRRVFDAVRSRPEISGTVLTGWRDTPISTSGLLNDFDEPVYDVSEVRSWNAPDRLVLLPRRSPPWARGGNRPGWTDPQVAFAGSQVWTVAAASEQGLSGQLSWKVLSDSGQCPPAAVSPLDCREVGQIAATIPAGIHRLECQFAGCNGSWSIRAVDPIAPGEFSDWRIESRDPAWEGFPFGDGPNVLSDSWSESVATVVQAGGRAIVIAPTEGTIGRPFWRECVFDYPTNSQPFQDDWEWLATVSGDTALDPEFWKGVGEFHPLMTRIDTRTGVEEPLIARIKIGRGAALVTTLRPQGGLGIQPASLAKNAGGVELLRVLIAGLLEW